MNYSDCVLFTKRFPQSLYYAFFVKLDMQKGHNIFALLVAQGKFKSAFISANNYLEIQVRK